MTLLVGSSKLSDSQLLDFAKGADRIIAVDGGLHHLDRLEIEPQVILGDFDSYKKSYPKGALVYPREKNFSDMEAALELCQKEDIVILGATGGRLDHFLSVLSLMRGKENIKLVDDQNELFYRKGSFFLEKRQGYFSLFPERKTKITIRGAEYELEDYQVEPGSSLLLSNSFRDEVFISLDQGWVLVVLSRDK